MTKPLITILLVLSVLIVIAIFMQPTKNQSSNVFDASSNDLFERSKARGFEAVMQRLTGVMIFLWLLSLPIFSSMGRLIGSLSLVKKSL